MPDPFGNQGGGGDGHKNYLQCCVDKFDGINSFFWDSYAEYLGGMVKEKLPLYSEFNFTDEAEKSFEKKLSEFTGSKVSLSE